MSDNISTEISGLQTSMDAQDAKIATLTATTATTVALLNTLASDLTAALAAAAAGGATPDQLASLHAINDRITANAAAIDTGTQALTAAVTADTPAAPAAA